MFSTAAAAARPAVAPAPVPPLPAESVTTLIAAARRADDGTQTLTLRTHPEELGPVEVTLQVHQGVVSVAMSSASPAARDALAAHLGDLRAALTDAGLQLGSFDVGTGRPGTGAPQYARPSSAAADETTTPVPLPTPVPARATGGVDLHL
jgi:flagellar hook-length control protein FliK